MSNHLLNQFNCDLTVYLLNCTCQTHVFRRHTSIDLIALKLIALALNALQQKIWFLICVCFLTKEAETYPHADAKHTFTFVLPKY